MLIRFQGADRTVTGSCHVVEANGLRVLLDFGMYQGRREEARAINSVVPEGLRELDAVILSHGHLDHCGRLPVLARSGYRGRVYCTHPTADVARIVMMDAAKIQEEDASYLNRRSPAARGPREIRVAGAFGRERSKRDDRGTDDRAREEEVGGVKPLFTSGDVQGVLPLFERVGYGEVVELGKGVRFALFEAGHILGSAFVVLEADEGSRTTRLLFTADVGRYGTPIIRDPVSPPAVSLRELGKGATEAGGGVYDAVITESTYGTVKHASMQDVGPQLLEVLKDAVRRKGRVLLPSFAVGRTQTMLYYVQRFIQSGEIPEIPIFVDSPMGVEVSKVTAAHAEYFDAEARAAVCDPTGKNCDLFGESRVTFAVTGEESRRINNVTGAAVVIASSPTCEFGRILHHLKRSVENPDDTVVFVGWTPPHTLGRALQNGSRHVRILDRYYDLRCRVRTLHGLSAHADGDELLRFLRPAISRGTTAFVVHGEEDRCDGFAARLTAAGMGAAIAPAFNSVAVVGAAPVGGGGDGAAVDE